MKQAYPDNFTYYVDKSRFAVNSGIAYVQRGTRSLLSSVGIVKPQYLKPSDEWSIDYPWFCENTPSGEQALDPGYGEHQFYSKFLCTKFNQVTGIDIDITKKIPHTENFTAIQGDLLGGLPILPANTFDFVNNHSFFEHIGLGYYGDKIDGEAEKAMMTQLWRVLKLGGIMLIQVPYGQKARLIYQNGKPFYRIYNSLDFLGGLFDIVQASYALKVNNRWQLTSYNVASTIDWTSCLCSCIVRLKVRK